LLRFCWCLTIIIASCYSESRYCFQRVCLSLCVYMSASQKVVLQTSLVVWTTYKWLQYCGIVCLKDCSFWFDTFIAIPCCRLLYFDVCRFSNLKKSAVLNQIIVCLPCNHVNGNVSKCGRLACQYRRQQCADCVLEGGGAWYWFGWWHCWCRWSDLTM